MAKGYKVSKVVAEIGFGLDDGRKKLEKILLDKSINLIVVKYKDRYIDKKRLESLVHHLMIKMI